MAKTPITKRRDAASTRAAILAAARQRFLRESYDNVGLRDIAGDVGVDVALISRYFGSKEGLFNAVLTPDDKLPLPDGMTVETFPNYLCELVLMDEGMDRSHRMEMFIIMLRSASSPKAGEIIHRHVNGNVLMPIIGVLNGESATWRASMVLAMLMGICVLRTVMEADGLCQMEDAPEEYRERLRSLFENMLKI